MTVWMLGDGLASAFRKLPYVESLEWAYNIRLQFAVSYLGPNVAMGYEIVGYDASDTEVDEKQRLLITQLLAGEGPDVIILDGTNAHDFAVSGALMDLMDIAREAGVYDNLINGLAVDGALPYIPHQISAPLLFGPPSLIGEIHHFEDLVHGLAESPPSQWLGPTWEMDGAVLDADPLMLKAPSLPEGERALVSFSSLFDIESVAEPLYGPWLIVDNRLNMDVLQEYYTQVKRALDLSPVAGQHIYPVDRMRIPEEILSINPEYFYPVKLSPSGASLHLGYARLAAASAGRRFDAQQMDFTAPATIALARGETLAVRPFPAQGAVWQPQVLMAVNKNTKHPDLALHFIRMMLSDEAPLTRTDRAFPVTQGAVQLAQEQFAKQLSGNYPQFEALYGEGDESIQWLLDAGEFPYDLDGLMRSFDTVYMPGRVVSNAVSEGLMAYVEGRLPLEEAVAQCADTLNMYLLERQK